MLAWSRFCKHGDGADTFDPHNMVSVTSRPREYFLLFLRQFRVAEAARRRKGPSPKILDSDENFKPYIGQEVHYHMVYSAYHTELDLQICN